MIWVVWTKNPKSTRHSHNINTVKGQNNNKYSRIYLTLTWIYTRLKSNYLCLHESLPSCNLHHVPLLAFYKATIMSLFSFLPKLLFCHSWTSLGLPLSSLLVMAWEEKGLTSLPAVEVQLNEPIMCPLQTSPCFLYVILLLRACFFLQTVS